MTDEKVFAYFTLQSVVEGGQLEIPVGYIAEPQPNSVLISGDNYGKGTHAVVFEDGPLKITADLVYVGEGVKDKFGHIIFDIGTKRILNLISIGTEFEQVLTAQVHDFASRVQTELEPILVSAQQGQASVDLTGDVLRKVDDIEKHFWDRKR